MSAHRILVVEDEAIVALDIRLQLERLGYEVPAVFQSGEELLSALPGLDADLVLLDILLKGEMDGVETARRVKERFGLPVILLSALDSEETVERAKVAEPFAFIAKPFDERDLRNAVVISLYRHEMEQTLRGRERLIATTLESIQDGVLVADENHRIEFSNSVAESMLGVSRAGVRGAKLDAVVRLEDARGARVDIMAAGPDQAIGSQLFAVRADGSRVPVEPYVAPLAGQDGARTGWVVVIHDEFERLANEETLRRKEEQLRRSQKMEAIGRLTGGIAHDFNNLLTVILGYARLMSEELSRSDTVESSGLREDLDGIRKAALRSAALTRQLLAFSRHQTHEKRIVDVNQIVADMERMLERLLSDDVRMHVDLLASDARVRVDPSQLEQIIMNLVVNARDAMPDGGRLTVRTDVLEIDGEAIGGREGVMPGRFVTLAVRDTGAGISPEVGVKVFEPFFTTKPVGQGTGLGLSTIYGIVTQSGGYIDFETEAGRGTTFTVHLPVHEAETADGPETETLHDTADGSETVMVVEDDEAVRDLLCRVLRRKGYHVMEAANPGEALLLHEQHADQIALVVTDVVMPHISGVALAERLRDRHPRVRILFISAWPDGYLGDDQRATAGYYYMSKPIDPARFAGLVRSILDD